MLAVGGNSVQPPRVSFDDACRIRDGERDLELGLDRARWPSGAHLPAGWQSGPGWLRRIIDAPGEDGPRPTIAPSRVPEPQTAFKEWVLRFPSAPVHGLQRLRERHADVGESENFHTYRVLTHIDLEPLTTEPAPLSNPGTDARVSRIFLLHNGLNELHDMRLHYQLASRLIAEDQRTVCILRPFPAHLTRFAFQALAETPLDHYLWDGSQLFRQFMRHMLETQWLLSVLTRRSRYRCLSGANLLKEDPDPKESRVEDEVLVQAMAEAWRALRPVSEKRLRQAPRGGDAPFGGPVVSLRQVLRLAEYPRMGDQLRDEDVEPTVHVLGYSLGGFLAQSVFMSWPFLVASCSTLLSGGALRDLAPTAFAHPEEWQTVLHSLRYELDDGLMRNAHGSAIDQLAGIDRDLFLYFKRTFYEVFQQEYRGSFQSRLEAFRQRMLFVVGGNDPIVRPRSVLDSAPPGGINMVAIAGLGHFLGVKTRDPVEQAQRDFWIPEMAGVIGRFADAAGRRQDAERAEAWLDEHMRLPDRAMGPDSEARDEEDAGSPKLLTVPERLEIERDGALPGGLFEKCLDDLLARMLAGNGLLFILRNEVPTMLLDYAAIQEHAAVLHHDDASIARYVRGVRRRFEVIKNDLGGRICIVLPWNANRLTHELRRGPVVPESGRERGWTNARHVATRPTRGATASKRCATSLRPTDSQRSGSSTAAAYPSLVLAHGAARAVPCSA